MIAVNELTKRYGDVTAVDAITFTVKPGIVTGFLGPNGAGKSTTMRTILGLDRPTSGTRGGQPRDQRPIARSPQAPWGVRRTRRASGPSSSSRAISTSRRLAGM